MNNFLTTIPKKTFTYKIMVTFIGLYLALTPFDYMRNLGICAHITKILIVVIIIFFIINNVIEKKIYYTTYKSKGYSIRVEKSIFLFFAYMFLTMIISDNKFNETKTMILLFAQNLVFILVILSKTIEKEEIIKIESIWLVVMGIFSILITVFNISNLNRTALKFFDGLLDPNIYTASLIVPFLVGIKRITTKKEKNKILISIILINMILTIMMSGSRGSLIAIIIASCMYLLIYYKKKHKLHKILKVSLIIIILIIFLIPYIPDTTLNRFTMEGMFGDGGAGRTTIWKNALEFFKESRIGNKLLGNGIGTFRYNAGEKYINERTGHIGYNVYSHNIAITILIEGGIIGIIIIFLLFKNILISLYKIENKVPFCAVIGIIIAGMFVDIIYLRVFWAIIGYAIIYIKSFDKKQLKNEENI